MNCDFGLEMNNFLSICICRDVLYINVGSYSYSFLDFFSG